MGAGIPGMGIASLFYVAAALLSPVRELYLTVRGRSSAHRWRAVLLQFTLAVLIVVAVVAFYVGIDVLVDRGVIKGSVGPVPLKGVPNFVFAIFALVGVLVTSTLAALWVRAGEDETIDMIAAAHRAGVADTTKMHVDLTRRPDGPSPTAHPIETRELVIS